MKKNRKIDKMFKNAIFYKIHEFSNSGKTDQGINIYINYNPLKTPKFDKVVFKKKYSELSDNEFNDFKEIIKFRFLKMIYQKRKLNKESIFLNKSLPKLKESIPFNFTDNYGTYYINCNDREVLKSSGKTEINKLSDFYDLNYSERYTLSYMIENNINQLNIF
jgi:hypothetical protein